MKKKINKGITKGDITKSKIYKSAKELFALNGLENVSVDSIVEKAGVAKGTFYIYFESKEALITTLITEHINQLDINYLTHIESFSPDFNAVDLLFELVDKIVYEMIVTIGYSSIRLVYSIQLNNPAFTSRISNYSRGIYKNFCLVIEKGILQGEFCPDLNVEIISQHCVLSLRGLVYEWCIRYPNFDFQTQAKQHFKLLVEGIKTQSN